MTKRFFFSAFALLGCFALLALSASAQSKWVWQAGSTYSNAPGIYGTFQSPCNSGLPPGRTQNAYWVDKNGNFWVFGGFSSALGSVNLNDLWEFNPTTLLWTWQGGSIPYNQSGNYGTLGSASATNQPGARVSARLRCCASGNLWLFGGYGLDANGLLGDLNDLWELDDCNAAMDVAGWFFHGKPSAGHRCIGYCFHRLPTIGQAVGCFMDRSEQQSLGLRRHKQLARHNE